MQTALFEQIQNPDNLPHERIFAIEKATRFLEEKIQQEINDNSPQLQEQVRELKAFALAHFWRFEPESIVVQKATVSTNMLLFALLCRYELYMYEPSWRETSSHLTLEDIAPQWLSSSFIEKDPVEPLLFLSCAHSISLIRKIQQHWYTKSFEPERLYKVLKWLERRMSLLLTFPFDQDTFDLPQYRQKAGGQFLSNMALMWDTHAYFMSMYLDFDILRHLMCRTDGSKRIKYDEGPASTFLLHVINNIQGDSLCINYQKKYCAAQVRIGDRLIFKRRRPEVIGPTDMDIITEICGVEYSKIVHMNADVRLCDLLEKEEARPLLLRVTFDYYAGQKFSFPWDDVCVVPRSTPAPADPAMPVIVHIPVVNNYGVWYEGQTEDRGSFLQAVLHWMFLIRTKCASKIKWRGRNYDLGDWIDELLPQM